MYRFEPLFFSLLTVNPHPEEVDFQVIDLLVLVVGVLILVMQLLDQFSQLILFLLHEYVVALEVVVLLFDQNIVELFVQILDGFLYLPVGVEYLLPVFVLRSFV